MSEPISQEPCRARRHPARPLAFHCHIFLLSLAVAFAAVVPPMVSAAAGASEIVPSEIVITPQEVKDTASIYVHLPKLEQRTGAAVVICPGGGYEKLTMDSEGHDTAKWFVQQGVAGIVLKYRLSGKNANGPAVPLQDAHTAIRIVRQHATEWGVDPQRVGILGYSAGGHLASTAATHYDVATRPDFALLIYPVITMGEYTHGGSRSNLLGAHPDPALVKFYSSESNVTKDTPPTFLAHASDDAAVSVMNSANFYAAMLKAGAPAELHIYERGDHGLKGGAAWGIGGASSFVSSTWPDRALEWMKQRGLLKPTGPQR